MQSHYQGRYKKGKQRGLLFWIGLGGAVLFAVSLAAVILIGGRLRKEREEFRDLSRQVHTAETTAATQPETTAGTEPTAETEPQMLRQFVSLYEQNPEVFGWIWIEDTQLDYPVMHTPHDKEKYLHRTFEGEESFGGTPFLDARCTADSDNWIIYGHNMTDGSMFRTLMRYETVNYWKAHPEIRLDTLYEQHRYEVMAAFYDRVYYEEEQCFKFYNFIDAREAAEFDEAVANYREKSIYDTGVTAEYGDRLITLVTCASYTDEGRFVVVAREVREE